MARGEEAKARGKATSQKILDLLTQSRMTTQQIAEKLDMSNSGIALHLVKLRQEPKQIFVCGHESSVGRSRHGGCPAPIYAVGNEPDAEFVPLRRPAPKINAEQRRHQIIKLLAKGWCTTAQLSEGMHIVRAKVLVYLRQLMDCEPRRVYIARWDHPSKVAREGAGGDWAPVYALGSKPDMPKPKAETPSERHHRKMQCPAYREARKAESRRRYQLAKLKKKPQNIFSALGL